MNNNQNELKWDQIIESKNHIFNFKLKEVWDYRDLLGLLIKRDFVAFYKQTILGPIWFFIQPIFTTITFTIVFSKIARISTDSLPPTLFYMVGVTTWNYFSESLNKTSTVFRDNAGIFGKVYFPRLIIPISVVLSSLIKLVVQFILLSIVMVYFYLIGDHSFGPTLYIFLFPILILMMALQALGIGMIITALTNKYRDLAFLLSFGIQLLMYATPVIYPLSSISEPYRSYLSLNPMSQIIETARLGLLGHGYFTIYSFAYMVVITFFIFLTGVIVFNKVEKSFIDTV